VATSPRTSIFVLAFICAVLVVVGCVSTWAKLGGLSFKGTDANAGKSTLIAAIIALAFLAVATWKGWRWAAIVAAIPAAIAGTIAAYRLADIANFVSGSNAATAGWGVWVATIAGIALFVLCLIHAFLPTAAVAATPAVPPPSAPPPPEQPPAP
jgi:hypothetical protein